MIKKYNSKYFNFPIEVENENWEIIVKIFTENKEEIIYSYYDLEEKTSYSPYIKNAILASFIWELPKNILVLGFWAWSYAKYFKDYLWQEINITWVEIDSAMIEIAKNEFKLQDINYFNLDYFEAIDILTKKKKYKFDNIFIDLYDQNSKIPESLNNTDILKKISSLLTDNWKFTINYSDFEENKDFYLDLEKNILKALKNKEKIYLLAWKDDYSNVVWVYNLKERINWEKLILDYLSNVQNWLINYDWNLISKIFVK